MFSFKIINDLFLGMTTADLYTRDTYSPPFPPPPPQLPPIPPPRRTRSPLLRRLSSRNSNRRQDSSLRRSGHRSSQYRQSGTYWCFNIYINKTYASHLKLRVYIFYITSPTRRKTRMTTSISSKAFEKKPES